MIGRSIVVVLFAALLLCPTAVVCQPYEMGRLEELAGLKWGMTPADMKKATRFSMANKVSDTTYREQGMFEEKPSEYTFMFDHAGLQSVVIVTTLTEQESLHTKERLIGSFGKPRLYDPSKNAFMWKDDTQEITFVARPGGKSLIGFRMLPKVLVSHKYGPDKLSSLQGTYLGMKVEELLKLPHLQPMRKISEEVYETYTVFNGKPSTARFVIVGDTVNVIGLYLSIRGVSKDDLLSIYRGYKDFLVPKYGAPTHEDLSVPVMIWSEGDKHAVLRWVEKDSSFALVFR